MTANKILCRTNFDNECINGTLTELENLSKRDNMKIDFYTYYRCEYFAKMSNRMSQIIVAVYQD